jgi:hypothetical protein
MKSSGCMVVAPPAREKIQKNRRNAPNLRQGSMQGELLG